MCTITLSAALKWEKETQFLFVFSLVNHNICTLSSNDSVRYNEPQRAFWAWLLKATSWQIHVGEQGREEASSWLSATTTPAPHRQDFFSDWDSRTSSGWHILMADAHRRTMFLYKGVTAIFYHQQLHSDCSLLICKSFAESSNWWSMVKCVIMCQLFELDLRTNVLPLMAILVMLPILQNSPLHIHIKVTPNLYYKDMFDLPQFRV